MPGVGLVWDSENDARSFLRELRPRFSLEGGTDDRSRALAIAVRIAGGFTLGECGTAPTLSAKTAWILDRVPYGCCSDYAEVFVAMARAYGIASRELANSAHTFVEVYDRGARRWFFVDPTFAVVATSSHDSETLLDATELRNRILKGEPVHWRSLKDVPPGLDEVVRLHYTSDAFSTIRLVLGADPIRQDRVTRRLDWLGKPAGQFVLHLIGVKPRHIQYSEPGAPPLPR